MRVILGLFAALASMGFNACVMALTMSSDSDVAAVDAVSITTTQPFIAPIPMVTDSSIAIIEPSVGSVPVLADTLSGQGAITTTMPFLPPLSQMSDDSISVVSVDPATGTDTLDPQASGFWTGSDPFSFVTPSDWPTFSPSSPSTNSATTSSILSVTENSAATSSSVSATTTTTDTSTSGLSTSTSTHVHTVTASEEPQQSASSTSSDPPAPASSSSGMMNRYNIDSLIGIGLIILGQGLW